MIFTEPRDPRFITGRRGGTLSDTNHHLLALWAATCAEHVLHFFEEAQPEDERPRKAIELARAWVRGEVTMTQARTAAGHAMGAARDLRGAPRDAAYAIRAALGAASESEREQAGRQECEWQRDKLPREIRELVLDDQRLRNHVCWFAFSR